MKTVTQTTGFLAVIALGAFTFGCSPAAPAQTTPVPSSEPEAAAATSSQPDSHATEKKPIEAKTSAPAKVSLTSSARTGTVVLSLKMEALADIPQGVARIVIPEGVKLVKGTSEADLGALPRGATREHQVTLEVPKSGRIQVFAGVDCQMTPGILLHKPAEPLTLGE